MQNLELEGSSALSQLEVNFINTGSDPENKSIFEKELNRLRTLRAEGKLPSLEQEGLLHQIAAMNVAIFIKLAQPTETRKRVKRKRTKSDSTIETTDAQRIKPPSKTTLIREYIQQLRPIDSSFDTTSLLTNREIAKLFEVTEGMVKTIASHLIRDGKIRRIK